MKADKFEIRENRPGDDQKIEELIRSCLIEYGAAHEGTAWADPDLGHFSRIYGDNRNRYWVASDADGRIAGGAGIGAIPDIAGVCELQKMYCRRDVRGTGLAGRLLDAALTFAGKHYEKCYLETLDNMKAAQKFYEKHGFVRTGKMTISTGHSACKVCYIKELNKGGCKW